MSGYEAYGMAFLILGIVLLALILCWIFLPFILMGTNKRLDRLLAEQRATNALLDGRLPDIRRK